MSRTTPHVYRAGDLTFKQFKTGEGWVTCGRALTQEEADLLNSIHPDQDEHALEALAGVEVDTRLTGWRLALAWIAMIVGSWGIVLVGGYGLYAALKTLLGSVL